ncbi:major facilitator superfamily domain-containing protein [Spinellus fusiger]|nr:major facilitator superfamily domain-containing protein [Spinellus fusiger]
MSYKKQTRKDILLEHKIQEKKIVRALDLHIMPLFCLFYFTDHLDRANISNATLGGIHEDLGITPGQLGIIISAFYITYIIFEIPSNIILTKVSPVLWLSLIMLVWGTATLIMAFTNSFSTLLLCRLVLGAAESGYLPGILYLMSCVYKPRELSFRLGCLFCMASLSGIISGPLAYVTYYLDGQGGLHGWQYLFILEGVPTVVLSVVSYASLFNTIDSVGWLTKEQKRIQYLRMAQDKSDSENRVLPITLGTLWRVLKDWKVWLFSLIYLLNAISVTSVAVFMPTIIDGFGFSTLIAQLLTAPPALLLTLMILLGGALADKCTHRSILIMGGFAMIGLGYLLLLVLKNPWALYGALFLVPAGIGIQAPAVVGWSAINFPDISTRAIAIAIVITIGNTGGVIASFLYPLIDAPHYYFGNVFNVIIAFTGCLVSGFTGYLLYRENCRRDILFTHGDESAHSLSQSDEVHRFRFFY